MSPLIDVASLNSCSLCRSVCWLCSAVVLAVSDVASRYAPAFACRFGVLGAGLL